MSGGNSNDYDGGNDVIDTLVLMSMMRLMMVMGKLRVLQVTLLNVMEVPEWK